MPGEGLETLRSSVVSMGEDVVAQLDAALTALEDADESVAESVIGGDEAINETSLELEDECARLFGAQEPLAGDLRFLTASFKIITDLERIGDLAVNLAQYSLAARREITPEQSVVDIGRTALAQVERSLAAYETDDSEAAAAVVVADDDIDERCRTASETVTRELIERESDDGPWLLEQSLDDVTRVLLTIRDIERVADHAVNIAARTYYMVENEPKYIY